MGIARLSRGQLATAGERAVGLTFLGSSGVARAGVERASGRRRSRATAAGPTGGSDVGIAAAFRDSERGAHLGFAGTGVPAGFGARAILGRSLSGACRAAAR
jgi:hypothetical protein